jgi:GTPase
VAVVGNVDAGKSTTLGVLTRGSLDDGRGKVSPLLSDIYPREN